MKITPLERKAITVAMAIRKADAIVAKAKEWPPKFKKCKHCDQLLSASAFSPMLASSDGLRQYCKDCTRRLKKNPDDPKGNPHEPKLQNGVNKRCKACKQVKPLSAFDISKRAVDGHRTQCKVCMSKLI
jgi:hypothetical protein